MCRAIFEWGRAHVSHLGAAGLFLILRAAAALVAAGILALVVKHLIAG